MERFGKGKIKYIEKFVIRQPIFMNDGLFCSKISNSMLNLSNWRYFCDL